jgi:hypothetical protein
MGERSTTSVREQPLRLHGHPPGGVAGNAARLKVLGLALLAIFVLLVSLEGAQRTRWAIRYHDPKWLLYGLVTPERGTASRLIGVAPSELATATDTLVERCSASGAITVIAIGSSTTAGVYNDEFHNYPYLLGLALNNTRSGERSRQSCVLNLGQGGASSGAYGRIIEMVLAKMTPAVAIIYTGYSDIFLSPRGIASSPWRP